MVHTAKNILTEEPMFEYTIKDRVLSVTKIFDSNIDQDDCIIVASVLEAGNFDTIRIIQTA